MLTSVEFTPINAFTIAVKLFFVASMKHKIHLFVNEKENTRKIITQNQS